MRPTRNMLLEALDPTARLLLNVVEAAARDAGTPIWLVGGATRDLAAGRPLHDLDLAIGGHATALLDSVEAHLRADDEANTELRRTDRFGTASIEHEGQGTTVRFDLATLRTEHYVAPGALPEVRVTDSIEADLQRRDFTVNAIALGLVGDDADEVIDPHGGLPDIATRTLRVLHDRSFVDDATRLWRGARTAALLGLEPDAATTRLIQDGGRWLDAISGERIWHEFEATAERGRALATLERLDAWGTLEATADGFRLAPAARAALTGRRAMPPERLAAVLIAPLPAAVRERVLDRLVAPRATRTAVADTVRLVEAGSHEPTPEVLEALSGVGAQARTAARWLGREEQAHLQRALAHWERTRPLLAAADLLALGVPRGPQIGAALHGLRRARYLGTLSTVAEARALVRAVIAGEARWDAS